MSLNRSPSLAEVMRLAVTSALESVHTAIPARVVSYDATTQRADVQPLVKQAHLDEEGERVAEQLPVVPRCPVVFPTGGGMSIVFPLAAGDTGLLVFSEASIDKWLTRGDVVDPEFDVRHALSDGVFLPGVVPFSSPRASQPTGCIQLGADAGTFQGAALGANLGTYLGNTAGNLGAWLTGLASFVGYLTPKPPAPQVESATVKVTP